MTMVSAFVEGAQHDVARAVGHEPRPVIVGLAVMPLQILAALFHFHQHDGFPDVIGKDGAAAIFAGFADAEFGMAAHVETAGLA